MVAQLVLRKPTSKKFVDLAGHEFGVLTVESFAGFSGKFAKWNCVCVCGKRICVFGTRFYRPPAKCRCARQSKHPLYGIWNQMRMRCSLPSIPAYRHYGGRGIRVCQRWNDFENFIADMGPRPSPKHSLGRINNDGHYEPGNCRWETQSQQMSNTRRNRLITFGGETLTISQWARRIGLTPERVRQRLATMPLADALGPKIPGDYSQCGVYKRKQQAVGS